MYEDNCMDDFIESIQEHKAISLIIVRSTDDGKFGILNEHIWNSLYSFNTTEQNAIVDIIGLCKKLYIDISTDSNSHILWFLFEDNYSQLSIVSGYYYDTFVDKINIELSGSLKDNVSFIDLKRIIAEIGAVNAYDPKGKYRWSAPYSKALIKAAVKEIYKKYLIEKGITKKCLVLDCDNVLWDGVLSEDGIENIKLSGNGLGRPYQDFQRFVLSLYYHGVILAVCSKNDLSDVMIMFNEHSEMILKEEHIACLQVNWGNKPDNIKRIAETLNISLDSMVFIDDSPIEVESVKSMLPEVTAILFERDSIFELLSCFNLKSNVSITDIEKRNETYRTNQSREALKTQYKSYDEYVAALKIKTDFTKRYRLSTAVLWSSLNVLINVPMVFAIRWQTLKNVLRPGTSLCIQFQFLIDFLI